MENNAMDKVESAMSLLNKLYRTVIYDGTQFNVLNPDEEYSDWEYTEDGKVKRVYSTTGQKQIITEFFYNSNGDLDKMVSSTNGKETSARTFSYDNKGRCIKEDSSYEIIVRSYDDENGTCRVETKDIDDEVITIEEFAEFDKISVENDVYKCIIMKDNGVFYRKISEVVYKVTEDIPLVKKLFEYDDENNTFTIKQFGRNSGTIDSDTLQIISEDKYRTDYDVELETSKLVTNEKGLFEEHRFVYTWNDRFDAITHSDYFINDKLEKSLDYKFRTEGDVEITEITGGTTISKYKDDQGISHEDAAVMYNDELFYNTFKTSKDGISVYNYAPAYSHSSPYIEIQSDNNKIEMLSENGKFLCIKFSLNGNDYEYRVAKNNINCYAKIDIYDGDLLKHKDEIFFKSKPDGIDDITKYIIEKFKEYISTNETLKLLLSKGGFDYEKIGGGITD